MMGVCFTGYCSQNAFKCLLKCVEPKVGFRERPWGGRESPGARSDDAPSLSLPTYSTDREKNQGLVSHQNVILGTVWANCDVGTAPRAILALFAAFELPAKGPRLAGAWLRMVLGEGVQGAQQPWGHGLLAAALMGAPDGKEHPCLTSLPQTLSLICLLSICAIVSTRTGRVGVAFCPSGCRESSAPVPRPPSPQPEHLMA